jgi:hypothetical protein
VRNAFAPVTCRADSCSPLALAADSLGGRAGLLTASKYLAVGTADAVKLQGDGVVPLLVAPQHPFGVQESIVPVGDPNG